MFGYAIGVVLYCLAIEAMAMSDEMLALVKHLHDTCVASTGVDEGLIDQVSAGNFVNDEKLQCYMKCIMQEAGVMGDDGIVDEAAFIAMMPDDKKDKAGPVIMACETKVGSNLCETAWLTNQCYFEKAGDDYFLI